MRRRLYFSLPDVATTRRTVNDLLLARIEDRHMHVLAKRGTDLGELREAGPLQKSDLIHGAELGMILGAMLGLAVGVFVVMTPPAGMEMQLITLLITALIGAAFGAWASSLIGASVPNSRLARFQPDIDAGRVLLMVDVSSSRIEEVRQLVHDRHPEATGGMVEASLPVFP